MTMECRIKEKLHESSTRFYLVAQIHGHIALGDHVGAVFHDGLRLR